MAGYSGTPLARKLGIKPSSRIWVKDAPVGYKKLVSPLPDGVVLLTRPGKDLDLIHVFTKSRKQLAVALPRLMACIKRDGVIWVSWPKRSSGVAGDLSEDGVREFALPLKLVDVKVCAVDDTWSGLKRVVRKQLR